MGLENLRKEEELKSPERRKVRHLHSELLELYNSIIVLNIKLGNSRHMFLLAIYLSPAVIFCFF
jgi:DNA polymerase sigma